MSVASTAVKFWTIGSSPDCDIVVAQRFVSGNHCRLTAAGSEFILEDCHSTNGTFVDGVRLAPYQAVSVTPRQSISLGASTPFPWDEVAARLAEHGPPSYPSGAGPSRVAASPVAKVVTIGRSIGNDIVIDYPIVSSKHARVELRNGQFYIEDTNSRNGTSIDNIANRIAGPTLLRPGDEVFFGSYKVSAAAILEQFSKSTATAIGDANFQPVTLKGDEMVIGRDPACDQQLDFPMISWRHARVTRSPDGSMWVEDLGSSNGTFVAGKRISTKTRLDPGQEIGLGSFRFQLLPGGALAKRHDKGYTIEAREVSVQTRDGKTLLQPVSFTVFAGELVALMGTSGAGKTTLLKALNGYTKPAAGTVFYNGKNLYQNYDEYSQKVGYVPQDDIVHDRLTVREALCYAARLRTQLNEPEIRREAERVAKALNLTDLLDKEIGSPERKILSGGQRKRVNIALELVCNTPVLFLDEPTSGLSSADADEVIRLLRKLARDEGKTIIATVHGPSLAAYKEFDNLILLARDANQPGAMVYYGPAYPDSIQYVASSGHASGTAVDPTLGPEAIMTALLQNKDRPDPSNTCAAWIKRYHESKYVREFVTGRAGQNPSGGEPVSTSHGKGGLDLKQWLILAKRNVIVRRRDVWQMVIMGLQAPLFALLIVMVFDAVTAPLPSIAGKASQLPKWFPETFADLGGIHFLLVVGAVWFGCNNAVRDVVGEWLIYQRERMVCLRLPSYVFSKLIVLSVICLVQCLLMLGIVYPACHLNSGFLVTTAVLWLTSMVGAAIGLLISSVPFVKTTESAIALLPIVLLPMIGLGGGIKSLYKLPSAANYASDLIVTRWAFEADMVHEAEGREEKFEYNRAPVPVAADGYPNEIGDIAQQAIPLAVDGSKRVELKKDGSNANRQGLARCLIAIASMFVILVAGVLVSLTARDVN